MWKCKLSFLAMLLIVVGGCSRFGSSENSSPLHFSKDANLKRQTHEKKGEDYLVATQGEYATKAAVSMFEKGGNVVDAATAASFVISVERPQSTGLGGGGFMLLNIDKEQKPLTIDFREMAPAKAHSRMYLDSKDQIIKDKSLIGPFSVGVPGLVAGVLDVQKKYGKLPLEIVLSPAIKLAREGFQIYPELAIALDETKDVLGRFSSSKKIFFNSNGKIKKLGEMLIQKDLARTIELISKEGEKVFYNGEIAKSISATIKKYGGELDLSDLENYQFRWRKPVEGKYHDYTIYSMAPPSSGGIHVIEILNILEKDQLKYEGQYSSKSVHLTASAMQAAFADRAKYLGDSDFVSVPIEGLLSKNYAIDLRKTIPETKALSMSERSHGNPISYEPDHTTHFTIMDKDGNVVSSTQTINGWFGSGIVAEGTGVVLNNEMDDFAAKAGASNLFGAIGGDNNLPAPGKRPLSSMSPTIVFKNKKPFLALGTPSGTRILTCVAQTVLNVIEYELDLFDAVASLRYHHQWGPDKLYFENEQLPTSLKNELTNMGHNVEYKDLGCRIQAVLLKDKTLQAVSDPRGEGLVGGI